MREPIKTVRVEAEAFRSLAEAMSYISKTVAQENLVEPEIMILGHKGANAEWFDVTIEGKVKLDGGTQTISDGG